MAGVNRQLVRYLPEGVQRSAAIAASHFVLRIIAQPAHIQIAAPPRGVRLMVRPLPWDQK